MATPHDYVELRARSAFSFLEGCSNPEDLVQAAADRGHTTLACADRDGVSGLPRFHKAAREAGIRAIFGALFLGLFRSALFRSAHARLSPLARLALRARGLEWPGIRSGGRIGCSCWWSRRRGGGGSVG